MSTTDLKTTIAKQLLRLGIRSSTKGYYYFRDGILIVIRELSKNNPAPHKKLYCKIEQLYSDSYDNISRALMYSLRKAWKDGNKQEWELVFKGTAKPPTPLAAITTIANKIYVEE